MRDAQQRVTQGLTARGLLAVEAGAVPGGAGRAVDGERRGERVRCGLGAGGDGPDGRGAERVRAPVGGERAGRGRGGAGHALPAAVGPLALEHHGAPGLEGALERRDATEEGAGPGHERAVGGLRRGGGGGSERAHERAGGCDESGRQALFWVLIHGLRGELTGSRRTTGATDEPDGFAPAGRTWMRPAWVPRSWDEASPNSAVAENYPNYGRGRRLRDRAEVPASRPRGRSASAPQRPARWCRAARRSPPWAVSSWRGAAQPAGGDAGSVARGARRRPSAPRPSRRAACAGGMPWPAGPGFAAGRGREVGCGAPPASVCPVAGAPGASARPRSGLLCRGRGAAALGGCGASGGCGQATRGTSRSSGLICPSSTRAKAGRRARAFDAANGCSRPGPPSADVGDRQQREKQSGRSVVEGCEEVVSPHTHRVTAVTRRCRGLDERLPLDLRSDSSVAIPATPCPTVPLEPR